MKTRFLIALLACTLTVTGLSSCSIPFASSPHQAELMLHQPISIELSVIETRNYSKLIGNSTVYLSYPMDEDAQARLNQWLTADQKCSYTRLAPYGFPVGRNAVFTLHWGDGNISQFFIDELEDGSWRGTICHYKEGQWERERKMTEADFAFAQPILEQIKQARTKLEKTQEQSPAKQEAFFNKYYKSEQPQELHGFHL